MNKLLTITAIPLFLSSPPAFAAEGANADFFILFQQCKATFAPLHMTDNPVLTADAEPVGLACVRSDGQMHCLLEVDSQQTEQVYNIKIDIPPLLAFATDGGGDFVTVHTTNKTAVISSRLADTQILGAKICHGFFLTTSELEALKSAKQEGEQTQ